MIGAAGLLVAPVFGPTPVRFVWNVTPSIPVGLYRIDPIAMAHGGDVVALRPPPRLARLMATRRYVEMGALLLKPVAATPGARVCRHGHLVTVNERPVAIALSADRLQRPLPRWSGCQRLRRDALFLLATERADSFDSRYFGPIDRAAVLGRATLLWSPR